MHHRVLAPGPPAKVLANLGHVRAIEELGDLVQHPGGLVGHLPGTSDVVEEVTEEGISRRQVLKGIVTTEGGAWLIPPQFETGGE